MPSTTGFESILELPTTLLPERSNGRCRQVDASSRSIGLDWRDLLRSVSPSSSWACCYFILGGEVYWLALGAALLGIGVVMVFAARGRST